MFAEDNPYASPQSIASEDLRIPPRLTIRGMMTLLGVGLAGGAILGVLTNVVNGALSPQYYRDVMGWYGPNIWLSAVGQGALEGACYGFAYAIIFVFLIAVAFAWFFPNLCDPYYFGYQFMWRAIGYYAWVLGSILGGVYGGLCSVFLTNVIYAFRHRHTDLNSHFTPQSL